ncbi:MAG: class I SAM-dependent methyltransferase [Gemmatimonadota bacterium]|nr:MAG: class I SAM-dependent methyltransferase [Gemmatimonadota bacterium]
MSVRYPSMKHHFARVAPRYRQMRDLDMSAVREIARIVRQLAGSGLRLVIVDVGSGTGRYLEAVLAACGLDSTRPCCAIRYDATREMLCDRPDSHARSGGTAMSVVGLAEFLPFATHTVDAALALNAIHHFQVTRFLAEVGRVLRPDGKLIIYTRTPEQNRRTVWGRLFPRFADKEDRLFTEEELATALDQTGAFGKVELLAISWSVETNLSRLIEQARCGAYSTFEFYSRREFQEAVETFAQSVLDHFADPSRIVVQNDHLLAVATKKRRPRP